MAIQIFSIGALFYALEWKPLRKLQLSSVNSHKITKKPTEFWDSRERVVLANAIPLIFAVLQKLIKVSFRCRWMHLIFFCWCHQWRKTVSMNEWMIPILIWPSPLMHICSSFISYYFVLCFSNPKTQHIQTNNLLFKMSHTFHFHFILSASKWTVNWDCAGGTTQCAAGKRIIICYSSNELIPDADEHRKKIELESESVFLKGFSYVIFVAKTPNNETFVAACLKWIHIRITFLINTNTLTHFAFCMNGTWLEIILNVLPRKYLLSSHYLKTNQFIILSTSISIKW